jgi:hypothetical protein
MTRVGVEQTIPVFDRAKTVHALDRAATVIYPFVNRHINICIAKNTNYAVPHYGILSASLLLPLS